MEKYMPTYYSNLPKEQKNWVRTIIMILLGVLLLIFVIWLIQKLIEKWKSNARVKKDKQVNVDSTQLIPNKNYGTYALAIYEALDGVSLFYNQKKEAIQNWMDLNDEEFKEVHNIFNKEYASDCWFFCDNKTTLRSWLKKDTFAGMEKLLDATYERMNKLGLP